MVGLSLELILHNLYMAAGNPPSIFIQIKQIQNHLNFHYPYLVKLTRYTRESNENEQDYDNCYRFVHSNDNDTIQFEFLRASKHARRYRLRLNLNDRRQHVKYTSIVPIMLTNEGELDGTSDKKSRTFIVETM